MSKRKLLYFLPLIALVCGCTDGIGDDVPGLNDRSARITMDCSINQHYLSRVDDGGFAGGDAIGVYIIDYADGKPGDVNDRLPHAKNVKHVYQAESGSWESEAPVYWQDNETHIDAYSYYPYMPVVEDAHAVSHTIAKNQDKEVPGSSMSAYEASDFLWAKHTDAAPLSTLELNHQHLMSSVCVSLIEGENFAPGEWAQSDKAVTVTNTVLNTTIDLADGKVSLTPGGAVESIIPHRSGNDWWCIVAPQFVAPEVTLVEIAIDGDLYKFERPETTEYLPGKRHNILIKVDKRQKDDYAFTLVSESITAWEADLIGHGGESRSYITVDVPEAGGLQRAIDDAGLRYKDILNLKITGEMNDDDFRFIVDNLVYIEAINLGDVRTVDCTINSEKENDVLPDFAFYHDAVNNSLPYLKYIVFPKKLTKIGRFAFKATTLTQTILLPEGLIYIGEYAFNSYNNNHNPMHISKLIFPSTLRYIGDYAFAGCDMRQDISLPSELEYLGAGAFDACSALSGELHLPEGIKSIKRETFYGNTSLSGRLEIPGHIETIEEWAFARTGFAGLTINEGVKNIGIGAFSGMETHDLHYTPDICSDVKPFSGNLVLPKSIKRVEKYAFAYSGFQHVYIKSNPEELSEGLFAYCTELMDTFYVPQKVNHLDKYVFYHCEKLEAIVLPENLLTIEEQCFAHCYGLDYLQCLATTPPELIGEGHFDGVAKDNFTLVVPEGCVDAYRNAPGWGEFKRISEYRNFVCRPQTARLLNKPDTRTIVLNADEAWQVTHTPSWMHIDKTSGSKKTELKVTIDALPHGSHMRTDSIVFTLSGSDITTCYKVEQYDFEYDEDEAYTMQTATKGAGIDLVFVGDGYDAKDIAGGTYLNDMKQSVEYFFDVEPYRSYRDYFNVYIPFAMSYESGIGTVNTLRNVKFGTFAGDGITRMSCDFDKALYYSVDHTPVRESDIDRLTVVVTPNTDVYDGVTQMYGGGYGQGAAVALCPKSAAAYPFDARGTVQHEAGGHAFGKFADEYIYHLAWIQTCGCTCKGCGHVKELLGMHNMGWGKNMSLTGKYGEVEWQHLIDDNRFNDIVDIYEGGFFHSRGSFRSERNSCMNDNVPYYSTWCREMIVRRIKQLAGEQFNFEEFAALDSKEWGKDFTSGSRTSHSVTAAAPHNGHAPIIMKRRPKRPANQNR